MYSPYSSASHQRTHLLQHGTRTHVTLRSHPSGEERPRWVRLGDSIKWGAWKEAVRIAQVKLFGSLLFPPLYYSQLPWRNPIYNHSTRADWIHHLFSPSCSPQIVSEERRARDDILTQWKNPPNLHLPWQKGGEPEQRTDRKTGSQSRHCTPLVFWPDSRLQTPVASKE